MPIDKDPEVFKLLAGIVGVLALAIGSLFLKLFFGLKETIEKIFGRVNSTDHRVTEHIATCKERHKND